MIGRSSVWAVLGIAPTTDIAAIKSAYAAKAKEYHPEEHPQEFQELQKAYKSAIQYAKQGKKKVPLAEAPKFEPDGAMQKEILQADERTEFQAESKEEQTAEFQEHPQTESQTEYEAQQDTNFDYGEVDQDTLAEQFYKDFLNIARSPYLMNNTVGWKWFLEQKEYQELFLNDVFRKNLVRKMCTLSGWHKKTLCFFHQWFQKYQGKQNRETDYFLWRLKRYRIFNKSIFPYEWWITREQKRIHEVIVNRVKKQGGNVQLDDEQSAACYIQTYLQYAETNNYYIYQYYKQSRMARCMIAMMLIMIIAIYVWGHMVSREMSNGKSSVQQQMQERNEKFNQERMENLKKYNEQLQEQILYTLPAEETEQETESSMESAE